MFWLLMIALPSHVTPATKQDFIDTWQARGRIPVPSKAGTILDVLIVHLYEAASVDGLALDLLVEARSMHRSPMKRFEVIFSDSKPLGKYPIPVLWWPFGDSEIAWL